jgi:DNA invertase Pin-like site-specific DNA recombinase
MKRAAIYTRVSTKRQDTATQLLQLKEVAERSGFDLVGLYEDEGISGAKGRDKRPGLDNLLNDATRKKFDVVLVWAIDRLGRSLGDLISTMTTLREAGVDLLIYKQAMDTSTSTGKLMYQLLGVFAEFEREIIRERVRAGIARAVANGARLGRKPMRPRIVDKAMKLRNEGYSLRKIAKELNVSHTCVATALKDPAPAARKAARM